MSSENTSGQGKSSAVPAEIKKWNWGAFFLTWVWGICHNVYISFLAFVPVVNIIVMFILGKNGNEWAWQNKRWDSVDHFLETQRKWAKWGKIIFIGFFVIVIGLGVGNCINKKMVAEQNVINGYKMQIKEMETEKAHVQESLAKAKLTVKSLSKSQNIAKSFLKLNIKNLNTKIVELEGKIEKVQKQLELKLNPPN